MSAQVEHIRGPVHSAFITNDAVATVRKEAFTGPSPVLQELRDTGKVAFWGENNDWPQQVIDDIDAYPLMGGVIDMKVDLLYSGGIRYGKVVVDQNTGMERMIPQRIPAIDKFFRDSNINLFLREAATDWYTFANVFVEFQMAKNHKAILGIGAQDASHVRLGTMTDKAEIKDAYIADWAGGASEASATRRQLIDPYFRPVDQVLNTSASHFIYPIRDLVRGQFYYGKPTWDGHRTNGWFGVAKRIPELKEHLLKNLLHIRYHIEFDERYFSWKYKDTWEGMSETDRITKIQDETRAINEWLRGKGQGGAWGTHMIAEAGRSGLGTEQISLVKIHDKQITTTDGAYIEDSQEIDFIAVRDMGLNPSLYGISPSKSGSSPGSGSEARVQRTNHVLNCKSHQDKIMEPLYIVRDVNKWPADIEFWMAGYYAATVDRTMQVDRMPNAGLEK